MSDMSQHGRYAADSSDDHSSVDRPSSEAQGTPFHRLDTAVLMLDARNAASPICSPAILTEAPGSQHEILDLDKA